MLEDALSAVSLSAVAKALGDSVLTFHRRPFADPVSVLVLGCSQRVDSLVVAGPTPHGAVWLRDNRRWCAGVD